MKSKLRTILFVLFAAHLTISCSSDGDIEIIDIKDNEIIDIEDDSDEITFAFDKVAIIATNDEQIFQLDVSIESEVIKETNLTNSIGVQIPNTKIVTNESQVAFLYQKGHQNYSAVTKDLENQNVQFHDLVCGFESSNTEVLNFIAAIKDYLLVFTYNPSGTYGELFVWSKHLPTGNCQKISFGQGYQYKYDRIIYEEDQLIVGFTNHTNQYTLAWIDLISGDTSLNIPDKAFSATINEGIIHMLFSGSTSTLYEAYDPRDWSKIENQQLAPNIDFGYWGLVQTQMDQKKVLVEMNYAQPSAVNNGPAILNLATGNYDMNTMILNTMRQELSKKYPKSIELTTYQPDLKSNTIVVGYEKRDDLGNTSGGLVMSNFEGEILKDLSLPYAPLKIVLIE